MDVLDEASKWIGEIWVAKVRELFFSCAWIDAVLRRQQRKINDIKWQQNASTSRILFILLRKKRNIRKMFIVASYTFSNINNNFYGDLWGESYSLGCHNFR